MNALERYNVQVSGREDGPVLLFAHGFGCDQNMWRLLTPAFEHEFRIVLFDYIGHGGSDRSAYDSARYATLDGYANDILEICTALSLQDVTFVGHSVSAMIGILAAIRDPSPFRRLVLIAPSPSYIDDGDYKGGFKAADIDGLLEMLDSNYLGWAATMAPVIMSHADRPQLSQELENSFCRTDPQVAKHFARATFLSDHRAALEQTPVPALIMQVTQDALAPVEVGRYMSSRMPKSQLVLVDTVGHCPHLSAPDLTSRAMRAFIEA